MAERLHRSRDDRMLAGVAAGVAETLDADPSIVRIIWAFLAIVTGGVAVVVYIVMAIVVPEEPESLDPIVGSPGTNSSTPATEPAAPATEPAAPAAPAAPAGSPTGSPTEPAAWTRSTERAARRAARRAGRQEPLGPGRAGPIAGILLIVVGGFFLLRQLVPGLGLQLWWPIAIVTLGILLIVFAVRPSRPPD